ncbi:MAG: adenylate/guanylate cyclase domain-containing protein [Candidatus Eremiobacteraeota bacterium]|nr:adenylate/guanylate cyclase domain-containing protein [Candidatus Eremiobacteraeota bacterium]
MNRYWPVVAVLLGCLVVMFGPSPYRNKLEYATYNFRQDIFPATLSDRILIGAIDEKSEELFGPFPWDRSVHGLLLGDLADRGAKAVFFDLIFDVEKPEDIDFSGPMAKGFTILAGSVEDGPEGPVAPTISPPLAEKADVGIINKAEDEDEIVRFSWLAIAVDHSSWPNRPILSPALLAYLQEQGVAPEKVSYSVNGLPLEAVLPNAFNFPLVWAPGEIVAGDLSIPCEVSISSADEAVIFLLPIRYAKPQTAIPKPGPNVVSYVDLPETEVAGKFIWIGEASQAPIDVVKAPTGKMKGVEAHANALNALLSGSYLRLMGNPSLLYLLIAFCLWGALNRVHRGRVILIRCLLCSAVYLAINLVAFTRGLWLPLAMPLTQIFVTGGALIFFMTEVARRTFASLTTKEAAHEMLMSDTGEELEATTVNATIIVSDIRGYTTLSETRTPVQMVELLNQYHTETVAIYERYGGRALTYQGDAQLIVFGYPNKIKNPAKASVQAAAGLQEAVFKLRKLWNVSDDTFSVGAACCTGSVAIGRLGARGEQIQYTVIGDPVRRAHKIQSLSGELDSPVLMDPETAAQIGTELRLESLGVIEVPGLDRPLELHRPTS